MGRTLPPFPRAPRTGAFARRTGSDLAGGCGPVLDYKTNRPPPEQVADVAPLYLRQMAAYRALLRAAFPGRVVECALVWTYGARFMALPDAVLDPHAPGIAR